jgi:hypothetical protein
MLNREKQREKSGRRKRHHKTRTLAAVPNDPALYFNHLLSAKQEAVPIFTRVLLQSRIMVVVGKTYGRVLSVSAWELLKRLI